MAQYLIVNLKMRLQPMHRHDLEDVFAEYCQDNHITIEVSGGGTAISDDGEPLECDIELEGFDGLDISAKDLQAVRAYFEPIAPKGSSLILYQDDDEVKKIAIGTKAGLALYLNGTELDDDVYQNGDINVVVDECMALLGDLGAMESYWEGGQDTALYFYGGDFLAMKQAIEPFLQTYPLCQKCKIEQIA